MSDIETLRCTNCLARVPKKDAERLDDGDIIECQYCGTSIRIKSNKQRPKIIIDIPPVSVRPNDIEHSDWIPYESPTEYYHYTPKHPYTTPNERVRLEYPTSPNRYTTTWVSTY